MSPELSVKPILLRLFSILFDFIGVPINFCIIHIPIKNKTMIMDTKIYFNSVILKNSTPIYVI